MIPDAPEFTADDWKRCRETGDYKPILFEWYKFVGSLCFVLAHIQPNSPCYRAIRPIDYYVLVGLLNRCAKLMLSNVALSHEGQFGETTAIVDRCIFESAIKIMWFCRDETGEEIKKYLAEGLRPEIELEKRILADIANADNCPTPIQSRMLSSIENHISASGLTRTEISSISKSLDLAAVIKSLGMDRLTYIVGQKIGSHHVHGTWSGLLFSYLESRDEIDGFKFGPTGEHVSTHINQYMYISVIMLDAMSTFIRRVVALDEAKAFSDLFQSTREEVLRVYAEAGEDAR